MLQDEGQVQVVEDCEDEFTDVSCKHLEERMFERYFCTVIEALRYQDIIL